MKLDDAIFALQVFISDLGGRIEEIRTMARWPDGAIFMAYSDYPVVPRNSAFSKVNEWGFSALVDALLGFGDLKNKFVWLKNRVDAPAKLFVHPIKPTARERLLGQALGQSSSRRWGRLLLNGTSQTVFVRR